MADYESREEDQGRENPPLAPKSVTLYIDYRSRRWKVQTFNAPSEAGKVPLVQYRSRVTSHVRRRQEKQAEFLYAIIERRLLDIVATCAQHAAIRAQGDDKCGRE